MRYAIRAILGLMVEKFSPSELARALAKLPRKPRKRSVYTCVECGKEFEAGQKNALYCSRACQVKAYRRRKASTPSPGEPGA